MLVSLGNVGIGTSSPTSKLDIVGAYGAKIVQNSTTSFDALKFWLGISCTLLLWGLDPVVAYKLIHAYDLSALDLSIVRFWSLSAISGILLLWQAARQQLPQVRLPLKNFSLWVSVFLLIGISFTSYNSLQNTLPSHYTIPMTTAGILLTSIVNKKRWRVLIFTWACLIAGTILLIAFTPEWSWEGIIFTLLAVLSFSLFSVVSERYKGTEHIAARAAQYFFLLSILCAALTIPFLPLATVWTIPTSVLARMALFAIIFAGLPYYIYYYLLTHKQIDFVLRYSFLIIFATVGGQIVWLQQPLNNAIFFSAVLVIISALLPMLHMQPNRLKNMLFRISMRRSSPV